MLNPSLENFSIGIFVIGGFILITLVIGKIALLFGFHKEDENGALVTGLEVGINLVFIIVAIGLIYLLASALGQGISSLIPRG